MKLTAEVEGLARLASSGPAAAKIVANELEKALLASGLMVEKSAKQSIASGDKTGRTYRRGGVTHRASAPGEAPASDTGRLLNSINVRPVEGEFAVDVVAGGGAVDYARHLEFGTRNMAARPFLFPALEQNKPAIRKRIRAATDKAATRIDKSARPS